MKRKRMLIIKPVVIAAFILIFATMCPSIVGAEENGNYTIDPLTKTLTFVEGVKKEKAKNNSVYFYVKKDGVDVKKSDVKLTVEPELLPGMKFEYDRKVTGPPSRLNDWKPGELERKYFYTVKLWTPEGDLIKEFKNSCTIVVLRDSNGNGIADRKDPFVLNLSPKSQEIVEAGVKTEINPIVVDPNRDYPEISVEANATNDLTYDKDTSTIKGTVSVEDWGEETSKEITVTVKGELTTGLTTSEKATIVLKKKPAAPEEPETPVEPNKPVEPKKPEEKPKDTKVEFKYYYFPLARSFKSENKTAPQNTPSHVPYIKGYPDGTFRPEGLVTKEEALAMILRLKGWADEDTNDVTDTWSEKYFQIAKDKGLLQNIDITSHNEKITRGEVMEVLSHLDKKSDARSNLKDIEGHRYEKAIAQSYANGRIKGYPDGTFKPDKNISRAEIVKILNEMFERENVGEKKDLHVNPFKDLDQNHWAYYEILQAANLK